MNALQWWLTLAILLFCIGAYGVLARRNVIVVVMSLEVMLNAVNIALVAIANFHVGVSGAGTLFSLFIITIAAAEVGVGLAIVLLIYRNLHSPDLDQVDQLRG